MSGEATVTVYALKYIGSKRRMVSTLAHLIPKSCKIYVEPYCGSAALALNSRKFEKKVLNDWNSSLANFWEVASTPVLARQLLDALQKTRYSRRTFEECKARQQKHGTKQDNPITWAVDTYILNWQSFNALGDNWRYIDTEPYYKHLTSPLGLQLALRTLSTQHVEVYNQNAVQLLVNNGFLQDEQAFIFLDPPYLEGLRSDVKLYQTDMPDVRDHINLLKAIQNAKAKVVLSGYWSGWDDGTDLYDYYLLDHGWHRHLLGEYAKSCETGDSKSSGAEWIWTSYDVEKEAPGALSFLKEYCDDRNVMNKPEVLHQPQIGGENSGTSAIDNGQPKRYHPNTKEEVA